MSSDHRAPIASPSPKPIHLSPTSHSPVSPQVEEAAIAAWFAPDPPAHRPPSPSRPPTPPLSPLPSPSDLSLPDASDLPALDPQPPAAFDLLGDLGHLMDIDSSSMAFRADLAASNPASQPKPGAKSPAVSRPDARQDQPPQKATAAPCDRNPPPPSSSDSPLQGKPLPKPEPPTSVDEKPQRLSALPRHPSNARAKKPTSSQSPIALATSAARHKESASPPSPASTAVSTASTEATTADTVATVAEKRPIDREKQSRGVKRARTDSARDGATKRRDRSLVAAGGGAGSATGSGAGSKRAARRSGGNIGAVAKTEEKSSSGGGTADKACAVLVLDKCVRCSIAAKKTPMMRKGPDGIRSLCNACGLKWSRHGIY